MKGGENKQPLGYTIIEVMIVLVVSGLMFLIAVAFINGKTSTASFDSSMREMASEIQGIVSDVTAGRYSDVPLNCYVNTGTSPAQLELNPALPTAAQADNPQCVFLGKYIHFYGINNPNYEVLTFAGATTDPSISDIIPITSTQSNGTPTCSTVVTPTNCTDLTKVSELPPGISFQSATLYGTPSNCSAIGDSGFGVAINTAISASGNPSALSYQLVSDKHDCISPALDSPLSNDTNLSDSLYSNGLVGITGVTMCFTGNNNSADVILGVNNSGATQQSELSARVQYLSSGTNCP